MASDSRGHAHRLVLAVLCALTLFLGLGRSAITDADEGYYAEAGREMVETGDWITPQFNYTPRFEKPILFYWLVGAVYKTSGVSETAARFFAALAGLGLVLIAHAVARRWHSEDAGLLAGAIVATSFGTFWMARQSLPDLPLAFFITLSVWAAIEAMSVAPIARADGTAAPTHDARARTTWLLLSAVSAALAMLMKGPVAALPALVVGPLVAWERWSVRSTVRSITVLDAALAIALFIAIAGPWYITMAARHPGYLTRFFFTENIERFATSRYNAPRPVFYYAVVVFGWLLPWSAFFLLWIPRVRRVFSPGPKLSAVGVRLVLWALAPIALFTASGGKQPRYILPCLVPIAILLARSIHARATAPRTGRDPLFAVTGVIAGCALLGIGAVVLHSRALFEAAQPSWSATGPLLAIGAGGAVIIAALLAPRRFTPLAVVLAATTTLFVVQTSVLALGRPEPVEVIAAAIKAEPPGATLCQCGAFGRNLTFYTHMPIVGAATDEEIAAVLSRPERVLAVVDLPRLTRVEGRLQRTFPRLSEVWFLDTAAMKSATPEINTQTMLLHPEPMRDLQRVILIRNR